MAEAILFPLSDKILSALSTLLVNEISLPLYAKKELTKLEEKITTVRNILLDAQEQQNKKHAVKEWLRRLKIILYEADDLFDEVATEALRQEIVINKSIKRKVQRLFTSSNPILFHYNLGGKIKKIRKRLDEICTDMNNFGFLVQTLDKPINKRNENDKDFRQTISLLNEQNVIGREEDKNKLLQLFLSAPFDENVQVIPIVGMGGLGKTTLAQMIFNDNTLNNRFDKKLWVCVSDDFNIKRILTNILTAAREDVINTEIEQLQNLFQEKLSGKKFFLVLDDVWNDDQVEWKKLEDVLMTGARGSRILVTTRDKKVAKIVHTMEPYELKGLSEEECLSILVKWAFEKGKEANHPDLIEIGREIVKKCGGVPLAARTLGVLLYSKTSRNEWLSVRDSEMWAQVQNENDVLPVLKLSYDQMPSSLKECFGYCSIFQKDEEISKKKIMYHWIALGFIQSPNRNVELEDVCETYLEELLRRSFLEYVDPNKAYKKKNDEVYYKMHDLVHDLATYVVGDEILIVKGENVSAASHRVRHVSLDRSLKVPKCLRKGKYIRTIMRRGEIETSKHLTIKTLGRGGFLHSRCLRVLDDLMPNEYTIPKFIRISKYVRYLCVHGVTTIPASLCELLNLQYLELNFSSFGTIPEKIKNLRNLRALSVSSSKLICLPEGIQSLTSLRRLEIHSSPKLRSLGTGLGCISSLKHLEIKYCPDITYLPVGIRSLSSLEHLEIEYCPELKFSNSDFQGLTSLKYLKLSCLRGLKQLPTGLQDSAVTLKHLSLKWCECLKLTEEVLQNLSSLQVLEIDRCPMITYLPEGIQSLTSLRKLKIKDSPKLRSLGSGLGCITFLEHLEIKGCQELEFSNSDFQGLRSLKYLFLSRLDGLKQLPMGLQDAAVTLKHLSLRNCDYMKLTEEVLRNLSSLEVLVINNCRTINCLPEEMQCLGKLNLLEIVNNPLWKKDANQQGKIGPKFHTCLVYVLVREMSHPLGNGA